MYFDEERVFYGNIDIPEGAYPWGSMWLEYLDDCMADRFMGFISKPDWRDEIVRKNQLWCAEYSILSKQMLEAAVLGNGVILDMLTDGDREMVRVNAQEIMNGRVCPMDDVYDDGDTEEGAWDCAYDREERDSRVNAKNGFLLPKFWCVRMRRYPDQSPRYRVFQVLSEEIPQDVIRVITLPDRYGDLNEVNEDRRYFESFEDAAGAMTDISGGLFTLKKPDVLPLSGEENLLCECDEDDEDYVAIEPGLFDGEGEWDTLGIRDPGTGIYGFRNFDTGEWRYLDPLTGKWWSD